MAESRLKVILETSGTGKVKAAKRGVDQLKEAVKALDRALAKTIPLQDKVSRGFTKLGASSLKAARGIKKAAGSLSSLQGVLGGLAIGALFKSAIDEATKYEAAILRISRLEGEFKNLEGLQNQAAESAKNLFVSQTQAAQGYANLASRIGTSVGSVKELQAVYEGLEIVLLKNAKTTQEAASLQLQLNQALGKGTLNGDEFRTIAENAPEILRQLATDAGVAESAIKDLASEGFVTTDKLIKALANLRNSGIEDFNALLETNLGKIRKYDKAVSDLQLTIGRDLLPAFTPLIEALTFIAKAFAALPEPARKVVLALAAVVAVVSLLAPLIAGLSLAVIALGGKFVIAAGLVAALGLALFELPKILQTVADEFAFVGQFFKDVWQELNFFVREFWRQTIADLLKVLQFFGFGSGEVFEAVSSAWNQMVNFMGEAFTNMLKSVGNELNKFFSAFSVFSKITGGFGPFGALFEALRFLGNFKLPTFDVGSGLKNLDIDFTNPNTVIPEAEGGAGKAAAARKKKLEDKEKEIQQNARLLIQQENLKNSTLAALFAENQLLQLRLTKGKEFASMLGEVRELMIKTGVDFNTAFDLVNANRQLKEAVKNAEELSNESKVLASVWNGFGQEVAGVFDALIDGTEDWNSVLKDTLKNLSKVLFNAGLKMLGGGDGRGFFSALTGGITGKASGGPVSGGTPYIVGEKGPELFTPGTSGNITPNDALGGSTVVNITVNDNGGGSASGSGPNANEARALARMIESSTLAIINREKRPGGTLSFSR